MKKILWRLACLAILSMNLAQAAPYPLGNMTCKDIGAFASQAMQWRESGVPFTEAKTRLDQLRPEDSIEKKNLRMVMALVYGSYGDSWTVESAGTVMQVDCEAGR
jgi:hypothetical protein